MKQLTWCIPSVVVLLLTGSVSRLEAQSLSGTYPSGPAVSPYLNLQRFGAPLGVNYFGLVQPQMQFQSSISQLQMNQNSLMAGGGAGTLVTGHPVMFGNYSHYYAMRGSSGGGMGGGMSFPGQRSLQSQRMRYNPMRSLGGMGGRQGIGGMGSGTGNLIPQAR